MLLKDLIVNAAVFATVSPVITATVVQWGTCPDDFGATLPVDCGRLFVPLDYTEPNGESLSLELLRSPAIKQPVKGSILLNFGGPGGTGREPLAIMAPILHLFTGGYHNLVSFDPRGTGSTIPFECLQTDLEIITTLIDLATMPRAHEVTELGQFWARAKIVTEQCGRRQNKTGELIGTAFTARDMMGVAEALGEDGFLRYWGISYGTTLGATLVSMFPDKVDRVVLDGVQNPHEYYRAFADMEEWSDSDEEFSHIFQHCAANPSKCALARPGVSASQLEQSVWDLLDQLKLNPVTVGDYIINHATARGLIVDSLYNYASWPKLTKALDMLINGSYDVEFLIKTIKLDIRLSDKELKETLGLMQGVIGIHCSDRRARAGSLEAFMPTLRTLAKVSRVMDGAASTINLHCAQWEFEPKERYEGDFQVLSRRPVLLVGNTWDGLTPLRSARNVSSGFEGSEVLQIEGYGHASVVLPSACALRNTRAYWQNGTLPEPGTVCRVDAPPFSGITWKDVLRDMDEDGEGVTVNGDGDGDGDVQLELRKREEEVAGLDKALEYWDKFGVGAGRWGVY